MALLLFLIFVTALGWVVGELALDSALAGFAILFTIGALWAIANRITHGSRPEPVSYYDDYPDPTDDSGIRHL